MKFEYNHADQMISEKLTINKFHDFFASVQFGLQLFYAGVFRLCK